jgi:hypothetical protein
MAPPLRETAGPFRGQRADIERLLIENPGQIIEIRIALAELEILDIHHEGLTS